MQAASQSTIDRAMKAAVRQLLPVRLMQDSTHARQVSCMLQPDVGAFLNSQSPCNTRHIATSNHSIEAESRKPHLHDLPLLL